MKINIKNVFLIFLVFVMVFTLSACKSNTLSYEAFVVDSSLSASGADYQIEMDIKQTKKMDDPTAPATAKLTVEGRTIEGTYSHSERMFPNNYYRHVYHDNTSTPIMAFDDAGRLEFFLQPELEAELKAQSSKELSEKECLSIAKQFIKDNISKRINFDNYTITTRPDLSDSESYIFLFQKEVNGIVTMDEAKVGVLKNGAVFCYISFMFNRISANRITFDKEKAATVMNKKLDTLYQGKKANWAAINYEEPEFYYMLLEDDKPAIYCKVSICFENSAGGSFSEMVGLLIT